AGDTAVARGAQQHTDVLDHAVGVDSYGNGIQIHDRKPLADRFELVLVEPAVAGVDRGVTHPLVLPRRAGRTRTRRAHLPGPRPIAETAFNRWRSRTRSALRCTAPRTRGPRRVRCSRSR